MAEGGGKHLSVRDLGLKPGYIICPICKQDGVTKTAAPSVTGQILCLTGLSVLTCAWCLLCLASSGEWAIHSCSQCGVTLCKLMVRYTDYETQRELADYVARELGVKSISNIKKEHETRPRDSEAKETPMAYAPVAQTTIASPLSSLANAPSSNQTTTSTTNHVIKLDPTRDRTGTWTVTSSASTPFTYKITVNSLPDWTESTTVQADWDRAPYVLGPETFTVTRQTPDGFGLASVSGTIDTRAGSWSTGIKAGPHIFSFCRPDKDCAGGASAWQLTTSEGTLFWAHGGWMTKVLQDAYGRRCAWLKDQWSMKITWDPRLSAATVDQIVAVAVALVVQRQRQDVWLLKNPP